MSYATAADLADYAIDMPEVAIPDDDLAVARLLLRASRDIDRVLGPIPRLTDDLKLDPALLSVPRRAALSRATCAQAVHRLLVGDSYYSDPGEIVNISAAVTITLVQRAARIAPRALEELSGYDLLARSATVPPPPLPPVA